MLSIHHGVEPDPRTAFDSISNEQRLASHCVVDDVVVAEHPHGVGADLPGELDPKDQLLVTKVIGLSGGQECRVIQRYKSAPLSGGLYSPLRRLY